VKLTENTEKNIATGFVLGSQFSVLCSLFLLN